MKLKYIIGVLVIAVAVFVLITTYGDASTYVTFGQAKEMAAKGSNKKIHVVGKLKKDDSGEIVGVEPSDDKLAFSFVLVDNDNKEQRVYYNEPMPTDFTRSEQVVIIGSYKNDSFIADKILLKCPSKYQENNIQVSEAK